MDKQTTIMNTVILEEAPVVAPAPYKKPVSQFLKDRYRGEQVNYHFRNTPEDPHVAFVNSVDEASDSLSVIYFSVANGMRYAHGVRHIEDPWNDSHFEAAVENGTFSTIENPRLNKLIEDNRELKSRVRDLEAKAHLAANTQQPSGRDSASVKKMAEQVLKQS